MANVGVVGVGLVGHYIAETLFQMGHELIALDIDEGRLAQLDSGIRRETLNAVEQHPLTMFQPDVWVNALPGVYGAILREKWMLAGSKVVDLSFTREDPREQNSIAEKHGSSMVLDAGIAPGLSNMMLAESAKELGRLERGVIRVGGIPSERDAGWSYMAPFSPADVIEEYERDARIIEGGVLAIKPAMIKRHTVDFTSHTSGRIGELEAFLTDGLRSLVDTIEAESLEEYTLRWPGHIQQFIDLQKSGMLVGPARQHTLSELLEQWRFDSQRAECTIMQIEANSEAGVHEWFVFDQGGGGDSSMARTTGLVSVAFVTEMLAGNIPAGVHAPEQLSSAGMRERICELMLANGVLIEHSF